MTMKKVFTNKMSGYEDRMSGYEDREYAQDRRLRNLEEAQKGQREVNRYILDIADTLSERLWRMELAAVALAGIAGVTVAKLVIAQRDIRKLKTQ